MNSSTSLTNEQLTRQLKELNELYEFGIQQLLSDQKLGQLSTCADRLRPLMIRIEQVSQEISLNSVEIQTIIQQSPELSNLMKEQDRLLSELVRAVQAAEVSAKQEHAELVPDVDQHQSRLKAHSAYQRAQRSV